MFIPIILFQPVWKLHPVRLPSFIILMLYVLQGVPTPSHCVFLCSGNLKKLLEDLYEYFCTRESVLEDGNIWGVGEGVGWNPSSTYWASFRENTNNNLFQCKGFVHLHIVRAHCNFKTRNQNTVREVGVSNLIAATKISNSV